MVQLRDDVVGLDAAILVAARRSGRRRGHLANFTDPLVDCTELQGALPARQARRPRACARRCGAKDSFTEAAPVQPDVQDPRRPGRGRRRRGLPAARDGAGHVRQLRQRAADHAARSRRSASPRSASASATRSRPGTSMFRTREFEQMEMEFFVPPDEAPQWYEYWCAGAASTGTSTSASRPTCCACGPTTPTSCRHYSAGTSDVEFLFPWGWDELEGIANRTDYDLTQHAKHSGEKLEYFDQATGRALRALRDRAGGRRHPHDDGVPARRLRRGRGRRRGPHRAAPPPPPGAVQGGRAAAVEEGHADARRPGRCSRLLAAARACATTTTPSPSAAATAARTRSARRCCVTVDFDTLEDRRRHHPRPGHDRAGAGAHRRAGRPPCRRALGGWRLRRLERRGPKVDRRQLGSSARALRLRLRPQAPPAADGA